MKVYKIEDPAILAKIEELYTNAHCLDNSFTMSFPGEATYVEKVNYWYNVLESVAEHLYLGSEVKNEIAENIGNNKICYISSDGTVFCRDNE